MAAKKKTTAAKKRKSPARKKPAAKKPVKKKPAKKKPAKKNKTPAKKRPARGGPTSAPGAGDGVSVDGSPAGLRVRMFRVGFGDFFLVSVPVGSGYKHILIDCGVHHKSAGSIQDAVAQMAKDCGSQLALLIMTHRHADHISGFGTCASTFKQFTVERVWMSWFEDQGNKNAVAFQANLTAAAGNLGHALAMRAAAAGDKRSGELLAMAENITGGMAASGATGNQAALDVLLRGGFKNTPDYNYYRAGDTAVLPPDLAAAGLSAQILGPPGDLNLIKIMSKASQQYLSAAGAAGGAALSPFPDIFHAGKTDYPERAFEFYSAAEIQKLIGAVQPDAMAAQAEGADKTLNNQSLVILFTFRGKNLLFAGDAQWGNWENFLYGGAYGPGRTTLTAKASAIMGQIDFYKVGHHGSTNATPKDAVKAMRDGLVGMCSTEENAYSGVPKKPLLDALSAKMNGQLARSDQIKAGSEQPAGDAGKVPQDFEPSPTGQLYIDYTF